MHTRTLAPPHLRQRCSEQQRWSSLAQVGPRGFTLVELLVALAIIGVLLGLLAPAVQMAREASRRTACSNNLKQLGLAAKMHVDAHGIFPTGGWGAGWIGDPDGGFGPKQPGGWIYNVLPYLEQQALRDLGRGEPPAAKRETCVQLLQSPLALFHCPTRRAVQLYPYTGKSPLENATPPQQVAKSDYVINKLVSNERSEVIVADVQRDAGMSNTVLAGEKSLVSSHYEDGQGEGDKLSMFGGDSNDIARDVGETCVADSAGNGSGFGAAHSSVCQFVFCDGSVRAFVFGENISTAARRDR